MASDKKTITRQTLASNIADVAGLDRKTSIEVVAQVISAVTNSLRDGDDVLISGFGKFVRTDKKSRRGRNPITGEALTIAARRVVKLRASALLRENLTNKAVSGKP